MVEHSSQNPRKHGKSYLFTQKYFVRDSLLVLSESYLIS